MLSNSPKRSPRFSPGYEGTENMFYFLNVNSYNLETAIYIAYVILVLHSAMKTHLLTT